MYARDFRQGQSWLTGTIVRGLGQCLLKSKQVMVNRYAVTKIISEREAHKH